MTPFGAHGGALIGASAAIILLLGLLHLFYTFFGNKLHPRQAALLIAMRQDAPRISAQTTMWRAWVGFNASHSLGAILFGLVYGYLALRPDLLWRAPFLLWLGLAVLLAYLALARAYWFRIPLRAILLATMLYGAGLLAGPA
ncbi:MAG: hypothetical protein V4582_10615 [Pseudomonadota bacterium]